MKRSRTSSSSRSVENVASGSKDEPPKKVAKKRVKSVTQSPVNQNASEPQPPAPVVKHSPRPNSASKLGSLPMYGEDLPDEGYASIPKLAEKVCGNLKAVMDQVKDCKLRGGSKVSARFM